MRAMDAARAEQVLRDGLARHGVLLVHDKVLPSATGLIAGEPVAGSWWSHPLAHQIYDALQSIGDVADAAKLLAGKVTIVAAPHWPALAAVGAERASWQIDGLAPGDLDLLEEVDGSVEPFRPTSGTRASGKRLEARLLVYTTDVHTESGHHEKVLASWDWWRRQRDLGLARVRDEASAARAEFEQLVAGWPRPRRGSLLPWDTRQP